MSWLFHWASLDPALAGRKETLEKVWEAELWIGRGNLGDNLPDSIGNWTHAAHETSCWLKVSAGGKSNPTVLLPTGRPGGSCLAFCIPAITALGKRDFVMTFFQVFNWSVYHSTGDKKCIDWGNPFSLLIYFSSVFPPLWIVPLQVK